RNELDNDPATVLWVAFPAHNPRLFQPVEHAGDRSRRESREIGELASGCGASDRQTIDDLHVRSGHPAASRCRAEVRRAQSIELSELARQRFEQLRALLLRTP